MITVSLNIGGGIRLIKLAKLYMCMQTHNKHDEDERTAAGVCGHGSIPLSHSGNVVTRIGLPTHTSDLDLSWTSSLLLIFHVGAA